MKTLTATELKQVHGGVTVEEYCTTLHSWFQYQMVAQEWTDQDWINANDAWNYYCSDFVVAEEEDAG